MHVASLPVLLVLAGGKLAGVLGGTGQGASSDLPWATSYAGSGPWGSLAAELPAHPAQLYEALAITLVIGALYRLTRAGRFAPRNGALLFLGLAMWGLARVVVGFTWRDAPAIGPLGMEQVMSLLVAVLAGVAYAARLRSGWTLVPVPEPEAGAQARAEGTGQGIVSRSDSRRSPRPGAENEVPSP
jgi:prolipoprotein diacylglyceryltransferase